GRVARRGGGAGGGGGRGVGGKGAPAPGRGSPCRIEFDRAAGWHRRRAEEWLARHAGVRDLGRTARLAVHYRMHPELAQFAADLQLHACTCFAAPAPGSEPGASSACVEFVCAPPLARDKGPRGRDRGKPADVAATLAQMKGGAGLEVFLDDPRHRDRLPTEARAGLPPQGLVNYLEAQAVVRALKGLAQDRAFAAAPAADGAAPCVTVLALYPAQAALIGQLVRQAPELAAA